MTLFTSDHVTPSAVSVASENQRFSIFMEILGWLGGRGTQPIFGYRWAAEDLKPDPV